MNDRPGGGEMPAAGLTIDAEHPWLGLASFTEDMQAYFFGRGEEVAELARRVQRKLLTLLFGQSGLGKTSMLRAGLVPRLRALGYCPVYVRIDYGPDSPPPSAQIKAAIHRETTRAGEWTRPGSAVADESLWEFLHHRDDVLRDAAGKPLTPLLIFDQFEEVFTLAQADDAGRRRAARFIDDLADLCENRPPRDFEARMEEDETLAERFDFTRSDYRVLIALREDYLAHVEALKPAMPSITQNRMRVARMTGAQALAAVRGPGGALVDEAVAEAIVRFVAGGAELANAEVEPSLLSLICRELNAKRIARGRAEIGTDLLDGTRDTILSEFYERAIGDQPEAVRRFVEDELLTDSGFRESLAEERVQKAFAAAGAPQALATLVDRRLLRIEERLDLRRVELTHDVLCSVVRASRDLRHEREARDAAEARLAEQREKSRATRKALMHARRIAAACAVLAVVAIAGAMFGFLSTRRAERAEAESQAVRVQAERARGEAEKLTTFLLDDFQLELAPVGRLDIVADLAKRALAYYDGLPRELRNDDTRRNRALALVRYGAVLRVQSKLDDADKALADGVAALDALRKAGDASEATAIGLATGISVQALALRGRNEIPKAFARADDAVGVIAPWLAGASPSVAVRRTAGDALEIQGVLQLSFGSPEKGIVALEAARDAYRSIADLALADTPAAAGYAEASAWQSGALHQVNRIQDAIRVGEEAVDVATRIIDAHPGYVSALRARGLATNNLAEAYIDLLTPSRAVAMNDASARDYEAITAIDPSNTIAWNNLGVGYEGAGFALTRLGDIDAARKRFRNALDLERRVAGSPTLSFMLTEAAARLALLEAEQGNRREAEAAMTAHRRFVAASLGNLAARSFPHAMISADELRGELAVAMTTEDYAAARQYALTMLSTLGAAESSLDSAATTGRNGMLVVANEGLAEAAYRLGDLAEAASASAQAQALRASSPLDNPEFERQASRAEIIAALVAARQGRADDARRLAGAVLARERDAASRNRDDAMRSIELARALYASAVVGIDARGHALDEATSILARLPAPLRRMRSVDRLREDIAAARGRGA